MLVASQSTRLWIDSSVATSGPVVAAALFTVAISHLRAGRHVELSQGRPRQGPSARAGGGVPARPPAARVCRRLFPYLQAEGAFLETSVRRSRRRTSVSRSSEVPRAPRRCARAPQRRARVPQPLESFIRPMGRLRRLVEGRLAVLARVAVGMHPDQTAAAAKPIGLSRSPGAL